MTEAVRPGAVAIAPAWRERQLRKREYGGSKMIRPLKIRHLGTLPAVLALGSCDLGEAMLPGGEHVTITWGRNLSQKDQDWFEKNTAFRPVWNGSDDGAAELVIPEPEASALLGIMRPDKKKFGWKKL